MRSPISGGIVGGPVCTRTAERSLQVNLLPDEERYCNLDCIYCPFPQRRHPPGHWPRPGDIGVAVINALHDAPDAESITVSGPGEATLHPHFGAALANVLAARARRPELPVRVVTNPQRLTEPHTRRLLGFADECIVRIDARAQRSEPSARELPREALRKALGEVASFSVESVFVEGADGNVGDAEIEDWIDWVGSLRPLHVYVTTPAENPLVSSVCRASAEVLEAIAERLRARASCPVTVIP